MFSLRISSFFNPTLTGTVTPHSQDRVSTLFWLLKGHVSALFWLLKGHVSTPFWLLKGHVSTPFWLLKGHVSTLFWLLKGHVSALFWLLKGHVSTIFWLLKGHVSTLFWLLKGHVFHTPKGHVSRLFLLLLARLRDHYSQGLVLCHVPKTVRSYFWLEASGRICILCSNNKVALQDIRIETYGSPIFGMQCPLPLPIHQQSCHASAAICFSSPQGNDSSTGAPGSDHLARASFVDNMFCITSPYTAH